ncbi:MAG TPA: HAMP domain-containing sensor histidine kinase [Gemmatimonadales bacterium]|nr:HAMP domain-containing sensor histidine kinase [Gemmatimonadales bacterium]
MSTIRGRLTFWYTVALTATVLVFGTALYLERRQSSVRELDQRLALEADFARRWLNESYTVLNTLVRSTDPPELEQGVAANFEGVRDLLLVFDRHGRTLYINDPVRQLNFAAIEALASLVGPSPTPAATGTASVPGGEQPMRYVTLPVNDAGSEVGALVVAARMSAVAFGPADLLRSMVLVVPLILLASGVLGWFLAGRAIRPVERLMDEVQEVTDGRSLHRRVAVPNSGDELARLAVTLNAMFSRLEQSFSQLRRFTADASHELKTPLMVLRAGVERSLVHPGTPAEVLEALDTTLGQLNQLNELVDSLLTLARADEGRAPLALEVRDLRALVVDVGETAEMLGEQHGLTTRVTVPDHPVEVPVDPHRMHQLLLNLVTNAVKYTPAGGSVAVSLEEVEEGVRLTVRDTGIGIASVDVPHIFDRFWRADPARSRTGDRPGVGLGLAITKWIAEAHGGSISVHSRPGRGSSFEVLLPKAGAGGVGAGG